MGGRPNMAVVQRRLTLQEFLELPEAEPALELHKGVVTQKMSPKGPHGRLQLWLGRWFEELTQPIGFALAFTETRVSFDGDSFVPDVIAYRADRVPLDERGDVAEDFDEPPDVAVEIWSPGQTLQDLETRCRWYVEHGVQAVLLVHPRNRWVRIFRPGTETPPLRGPDRIEFGNALPGFTLAVDELFRPLRGRPT